MFLVLIFEYLLAAFFLFTFCHYVVLSLDLICELGSVVRTREVFLNRESEMTISVTFQSSEESEQQSHVLLFDAPPNSTPRSLLTPARAIMVF